MLFKVDDLEKHSEEWNANRLDILHKEALAIKKKQLKKNKSPDAITLIKAQDLSKTSNKDSAYQNKIRKRKLKQKRNGTK